MPQIWLFHHKDAQSDSKTLATVIILTVLKQCDNSQGIFQLTSVLFWNANANRWTSSHLLKTSSFKLLDSNRQPVYYYNEHGQVEIVVITRKEFFKLTFLSFGIPNANRWDVEFSLSNLLKVLKNAWNSEIRQVKSLWNNASDFTFSSQTCSKCLEMPQEWNKTKFETMPQISLFHHKDAQSA